MNHAENGIKEICTDILLYLIPILITIYRDVEGITKENGNGFNRLNS